MRRSVASTTPPHQKREAIKRRDEQDEPVRDIDRSYSVSHGTISRIEGTFELRKRG